MSLDGITCSITATGTNTIQGCNCIDDVTTKIADLTCNCDETSMKFANWCSTADYNTYSLAEWCSDICNNTIKTTTDTTPNKVNYINSNITTAPISDILSSTSGTLIIDDNATLIKNKNNNESEKKEMKFNFGPCSNDNVRMSM